MTLLKEIYSLTSSNPGPKVIILGGVHGNEICGVEAIRRLKDAIKLEKGELRMIIANPAAVQKNVRYIEENLNRSFLLNNPSESYEAKLAKELLSHLRWADYCLDLHASNSPNSEPFIMAEPRELPYTEFFPVKLFVSGGDKFYSGTSEDFMNNQGKIGISVECGYLGDQKSTEIAISCLQGFLVHLKMIEMVSLKRTEKNHLRVFFQYNNQEEFKLAKEFNDFEFVQNDQLIGHDGQKKISALKNSYVIFARNRPKKFGEAFLLAEIA